MTVVCAWCGRVLKKGPPPVSHGICPDCAEDFAWNTHSVRVPTNVVPIRTHEQIDEAS